jgi:hypothetical protein
MLFTITSVLSIQFTDNMETINPNESVNHRSMVISYLAIRRAVGILGIAFPIVMVIGYWFAGGEGIRASISSYYHTGMRDLFVGILCAVALFLFSYTGYEKKDNIAGDLAAIFALGVAFFPTSDSLIGTIHLISAVLFFLVLAYYSLFLFTKGAPIPSDQKIKRNRLYRVCGFVILGAILLMFLYSGIPVIHEALSGSRFIFFMETLALWAFGLSWITKGKILLKDARREDSSDMNE